MSGGQSLRPYQARTVAAVLDAWRSDRAVLMVLPTGGGKTRIAEELLDVDEPCLFVAHRRELVRQTAARLAARFGRRAVGAVMPGQPEGPDARIQVATVQTLIARGTVPPATRIVLDEAHHYVAAEWRVLAEGYPEATRVLGLTATPQRGDGTPLGDVFDRLIVSAHYSELIRDGHLVPTKIVQPPRILGNDLARDPLEAWAAFSEGSQTFGFFARVHLAEQHAQAFRDGGVTADVIHAGTAKRERDRILDRFRDRRLRCVFCVDTLTEGVDVPEARTAILARPFITVGAYLQAAGRVLRPAPGKRDALILDLTGATLRHRSPTRDRAYSLGDVPISGGAPFAEGGGVADFSQEVLGLELRIAEGDASPVEAVPLEAPDDEARRAEYERLLGIVRSAGLPDGFAEVKYRETFGEEPRREWR